VGCGRRRNLLIPRLVYLGRCRNDRVLDGMLLLTNYNLLDLL